MFEKKNPTKGGLGGGKKKKTWMAFCFWPGNEKEKKYLHPRKSFGLTGKNQLGKTQSCHQKKDGNLELKGLPKQGGTRG